MKKEILDEPFADSFSDFLEKGETIIWTDNAQSPDFAVVPIGQKFWNLNPGQGVKVFLYVCLTILCFYFLTLFAPYIVGIIFILGITILFFRKRNTFHKAVAEYAITSKRILFKSNISKKREILQIPFLEIKNCLVVNGENKRGTIFLVVKRPKLIPFDTYALNDDGAIERRHQPTLENLKDIDQVAQLIRQQIQQNN